MSDHRRGRARSTYYDASDDDYYDERPPRHRSLGRQVLDKLGVGRHSYESDTADDRVDDRAVVRREPSPRRRGYHSRDRHTHHYTRRTHSESPTRHRRGRRDSDRRRDSSDRSPSRSPSRSRSRSRSKWGDSLEAAIDAAAIEALRLRKTPGSWSGAKGTRIVTAALSAAAIDAAMDHKKPESTTGKVMSALGGLLVNRVVNGPRRNASR
ncbi:hypothetical protein B0T22DRAFT_171422 [Podospora appendiculata]|uniref:Uncharacterized protein n=1 Tax=Podospora appendiculata TaxID=314037 RepID=A0AAE1CD68_9PEZI|nr:hypothetical protein B0T22DRAFT_171422 [Podospora appendiculata]